MSDLEDKAKVMYKSDVEELIKSILINYEGKMLHFQKISDEVWDLIKGIKPIDFTGKKTNFTRWITRRAKKITAERGLGELFYGKTGKRSIGIKFKEGHQQKYAPIEQQPPQLDLLQVGQAVDAMIQHLKLENKQLREKLEIETLALQDAEKDVKIMKNRADQANHEKEVAIRKLNQKITLLNDQLQKADLDNGNRQSSFTLSELATFK